MPHRPLRALLAILSAVGVLASLLVLFSTSPATASGGDFEPIDFAAEDPEEYDHATGGGHYGSDTDGDGKNVVEALNGGDFACGDIVTYFVALVVEDEVSSDDPQTIQLTNTFTADATGQTGAGLTDVVDVLIDPTDPAQNNNGGSTVTVIDEGIDADGAAPYSNDGEVLAGGADSTYVTYEVDDLESGETVIVRIDVQIECSPDSSPTGNLQGNVTEADVVAINDGERVDPDAVSAGNQTINFQKIGDLVGAGEPTLELQKTVMTAGGTCGSDDVESLDVTVGDTVTYCYEITNDGTADLENAVIVDDNGTPGDTTDDFNIDVGIVPSISSRYATADVTIDSTGTIINTATATGDDGKNTDLSDTDTATVVAAGTPSLAIVKTFDGISGGDGDDDAELGETLSYTVTATNDGTLELTNVVVTDDLNDPDDTITCPTLAIGAECVLQVTYVVTPADVEAGQVINNATADSNETDPVPASVTVPVANNPAILVDKVLTGTVDEDESGDVSLGDVLEYTITATNDGDVTLTNVLVSDDLTGDDTTCASVAPGQTCVLSVSYMVTLDDVAAAMVANTGVANSDQAGPEEGTEEVPVAQNPAIDLVKTGSLDLGDDGVATPGDVIGYTLEAKNVGDVLLTGVTVTDPGVDALSCGPDTLAPGESTECTAEYAITQDDIDAGAYENTAGVSSTEGATDTASHPEPIPEAPSIGLSKSGSLDLGDDELAKPGDIVSYSFIVTNTGNVTLADVSVDDPLLEGVVCSFGSLTVGASETCNGSHVLTQDDIDAGTILNEATADGDSPQETNVDATAHDTVDVPQIITLSVEKLTMGADDHNILTGTDIIWTYEVTNTGTTTLSELSVADDQGVTVVCAVAELAPGASTVCEGTGTATAGDYTNRGIASAEGPQRQAVTDADDSGYFGADPSITLTKAFAADTVTAGGSGSFTLVVHNDGNVDLTDVEVADTVNSSLIVTEVSATAGADADSDGAAQTVEWSIASLGAGESVTVTVDFEVASSTAPVVIPNTGSAEGSYTDDLGNEKSPLDEGSDTVTIETDIDLGLVKDFDPDAVDADGSGQFTLTVTNDGPSDADGVTITDSVDARLSITSVTPSAGSCVGDNTIECTVDLAAGESVTITVGYVVDVYLDADDDFDTRDGASFRFIFDNGFVLEGASDGTVTLYDGDGGVVETYDDGRKRNDFLWTPHDGDISYNLHLSCSELYGAGLDEEWTITSYSINRYKKGKYFRSCGEVLEPMEVPNTATAAAVDSDGAVMATDSDSVIVNPGGFITTPGKP